MHTSVHALPLLLTCSDECRELLGLVQEVDDEVNVRRNLELNVLSLVEVAQERLNLVDTSEKLPEKRPAVCQSFRCPCGPQSFTKCCALIVAE